jgi:hypothetical protein
VVAELTAARPLLEARLGVPEWNELGAPANDAATVTAEWVACTRWIERLVLPRPTRVSDVVAGAIADIERRRDRDEAIAESTGYRLSAGLRRQPWTDLLPADVCTMRLITSESQHKAAMELLIDLLRGDPLPPGAGTAAMIKSGEERWLLDSVPYQLPGRLGGELLTSDPPDGELLTRIRLPYRHVLTFSTRSLSTL